MTLTILILTLVFYCLLIVLNIFSFASKIKGRDFDPELRHELSWSIASFITSSLFLGATITVLYLYLTNQLC